MGKENEELTEEELAEKEPAEEKLAEEKLAEEELAEEEFPGQEEEFSELIKYTLPGYVIGLLAGVFRDAQGYQKSPIGQWLVRTLAGEGESIFDLLAMCLIFCKITNLNKLLGKKSRIKRTKFHSVRNNLTLNCRISQGDYSPLLS